MTSARSARLRTRIGRRPGVRRLGVAGTALGALLLGLAVTPPTATAAPVTYEAETATVSRGAVESNHAGFTGNGFVNYDNATGGYVQWNVDAAQAGPATLTLRYANGTTTDRPMDIAVNGAVAASGTSFAGTGAWTTWATTTVTTTLKAGANTIRATATTANGGPNVDHIKVDGATTPPPTGTTPAAINGQLEVCGTKLCNRYDKPIQLRGMSSHGTQWYSQCLTGGSLDALAKDWNADVLRVSTYVQEEGYETDPRKYTDLAHSLIEQATARGLYVIVDWHMLDPGDPHYNLARAKTFFTEIAQRHGSKTNLLYEIVNANANANANTNAHAHAHANADANANANAPTAPARRGPRRSVRSVRSAVPSSRVWPCGRVAARLAWCRACQAAGRSRRPWRWRRRAGSARRTPCRRGPATPSRIRPRGGRHGLQVQAASC
ncbi:cellulase family glycosylhydrolase [Streptomyces massasporeus]